MEELKATVQRLKTDLLKTAAVTSEGAPVDTTTPATGTEQPNTSTVTNENPPVKLET